MSHEIILPRNWTLRAGDRKVVFIKGNVERPEHVVMKALLWALYTPQYPHISIEIRIGDRYKPDVVALDDQLQPRFWGESGQVGKEKIHSLVRRYPNTHFAIAKWNTNLAPYKEIISEALKAPKRQAPLDLIQFPENSIEPFFDNDRHINVTFDDVEWMRFE